MENTTTLLEEGKKSLNTLLREKAYTDVQKKLKDEGIAVESVNKSDIEALVAEREKDMMNGIKSFATGTAFALLFSTIVGF